MSAVLAAASATFSYQGANVTLSCSSPDELLSALRTFGIAPAANDTAAPGKPAPSPTPAAATAPAGSAASPTMAPSAQAAAAPAAGDAGKPAAASPSPASAAASTASSDAPAPSFEEVKKAFLALAAKAGGREKCEGVNKTFGVAKLSELKPEQYAAALAEIQKASA